MKKQLTTLSLVIGMNIAAAFAFANQAQAIEIAPIPSLRSFASINAGTFRITKGSAVKADLLNDQYKTMIDSQGYYLYINFRSSNVKARLAIPYTRENAHVVEECSRGLRSTRQEGLFKVIIDTLLQPGAISSPSGSVKVMAVSSMDVVNLAGAGPVYIAQSIESCSNY